MSPFLMATLGRSKERYCDTHLYDYVDLLLILAKIMNPAFLRSSPVKTFSNVAHNLIDLIETESDAVPIANRMKAFTLDALGLSAFGIHKAFYYR